MRVATCGGEIRAFGAERARKVLEAHRTWGRIPCHASEGKEGAELRKGVADCGNTLSHVIPRFVVRFLRGSRRGPRVRARRRIGAKLRWRAGPRQQVLTAVPACARRFQQCPSSLARSSGSTSRRAVSTPPVPPRTDAPPWARRRPPRAHVTPRAPRWLYHPQRRLGRHLRPPDRDPRVRTRPAPPPAPHRAPPPSPSPHPPPPR